jgi:hypothetical protein
MGGGDPKGGCGISVLVEKDSCAPHGDFNTTDDRGKEWWRVFFGFFGLGCLIYAPQL